MTAPLMQRMNSLVAITKATANAMKETARVRNSCAQMRAKPDRRTKIEALRTLTIHRRRSSEDWFSNRKTVRTTRIRRKKTPITNRSELIAAVKKGVLVSHSNFIAGIITQAVDKRLNSSGLL